MEMMAEQKGPGSAQRPKATMKQDTAIVRFSPTFVQTKNVRNYTVMMDGLLLDRSDIGDERLGCVWGRAGRGKTRTVQTWAAANGAVYLATVSVWSEVDFLAALCRELGVRQIPHRKGKCFSLLIEALMRNPRPIIIDEIERFGQKYLEIVRDIANVSGGVIVLVGEEELPHLMRQNRRVWSRTYRTMEFEPIPASDIITYVHQCTGLGLTRPALEVLHKSSQGDLRLVRRDTIALTHAYNNLRRTGEVDEETARIAVKESLRG